MPPFSFIGIFCEDIREEVGGTHTVVGVLPDNVNIGRLPGMLPKLGVYIRIHLDKEANPKTLKARMKVPGGTIFEIADFGELIGPTKEQTEATNVPFAGLVAKSTFTPLPINQIGRIEAIVEVDGTEYICGVLNLVQPEAAAKTSSASAPPS
jgi:hypothetical protein